MSLGHGASIVRTGLVLNLDAANTKSYPGSGTTWSDLTQNACYGSLINSPTFSSNSFVTNDLNSYISVTAATGALRSSLLAWTPLGSVGTTVKSVELWFKTSDATGGFLVSRPWNGSGGYNYQMRAASWQIASVNYNYGNVVNQNYVVDVADGKTHQMVWWMDSTNMGYYIDGGVYSGTVAHGISVDVNPSGTNSNLDACIGSGYPYGNGWAGNSGQNLAGSYYSFRVYNKVLTSAEVQQNFNALRGRYGI